MKIKLAQVRYNTDSNGTDQCWRLVLDGEEMLVESVRIEGNVFTSRDWMPLAGKFKHHLSVCNCTVSINDKGEAFIYT